MPQYICRFCGYEGRIKRVKRGSKALETFLWTVLLIPGPFYSVWRRAGVDKTCANCGRQQAMVKLSSDAGWLAKRAMEVELGQHMPAPKKEIEAIPASEPAPAAPRVHKPVDPEAW